MEYKEGIYRIDEKIYHADPCPEPSLSRSTIKELIYHSPAHAKFNHPRLNPFHKEEERERFDIGNAAHSLLLEGIDNIAVVEADDWRTKAAKEERENARKEGKTPLLKHQYWAAQEMVHAAELQIINCKELGITNLQKDGNSEMSYIWQENGTWFRTRPDWLPKDRKFILDYKTTEYSANPSDYARIAISTGLDIQAALYTRGVQKLDGIDPKFILIVQEVQEPYICSFIGFTPQFMEMGRSKVDYGVFLWRACLNSGVWNGYPTSVCWIEPPAWGLTAWEGRASEIGLEG